MNHVTYNVTFTGTHPLLMHAINIDWSDFMMKWQKDPAHKKNSVAGDDRSPAWRWLGCLYVDSGKLVIPADNLMTVLREGGKRCPTGKGQGTFKAITQSGLLVNELAWPIVVDGHTIDSEPIMALKKEDDFEKHKQACLDAGFSLFLKRCPVGMSKHIRVRPRFDAWSISGTITVLDSMITDDVFSNIVNSAGTYAGIGDWRPSSPRSPGSFGTFIPTITRVRG